IERTVPSYFALMQLVGELPQDSRVYNLFEPRTYALPRYIQPDVLNNNFPHDLYYHKTATSIINYWKEQGYTHIIINHTGAQLDNSNPDSTFTPTAKDMLRETITQLELVGRTKDG